MRSPVSRAEIDVAIHLNAFPLTPPDVDLHARLIPYEEQKLAELRETYASTHVFRRQGDNILAVSAAGEYPMGGEPATVSLRQELGLLGYLVKDGLVRQLKQMDRRPTGFRPIELVSTRPEDNLLAPILGEGYPFQVCAKYTIDTRIINGRLHLVIDSATRRTVKETCRYLQQANFDLHGRAITAEQPDGFRKFLGRVTAVEGDHLEVLMPDGTTAKVPGDQTYLRADTENFDAYLDHTHGDRKELIVEAIIERLSIFNGGAKKRPRIRELKNFLQRKGIALINGSTVAIQDAPSVRAQCTQLNKPYFVFNDNGEADWTERGLTRFGPYTKRTFDRNDPSICVICSPHDKGRVEQFVRKLLKGMPSKYFSSGLEGKFSVGTSRVEVFTTSTDDAKGYKAAIETAIRKKADNGERWDLALVQVRQSFKHLKVTDNPYYWGKSLFFLHQVPVQDFTLELLDQDEYNLGFSLNNMGLACYAKMGGVPWLLKSSQTLSFELVVGIGSANVGDDTVKARQRVMGITTVFSGDGSYIVSNTSKAVAPDEYAQALTTVLMETIEKIQKRMNWQRGDTIRLIFHASVKKFNKDEIAAVQAVVEKYREYQIEYAFLKISEDHGLHMFDSASAGQQKGKFAPPRGKALKLSNHEMLVYLIGQRELHQETDGHPRGLILDVHKDSTFKDIRYLSNQVYSFASHSWRSYFPNPMPVTITYSDLIAKNLGWLNQLPGWTDAIMIGKLGQSQWFL